MKLSRIGSIIIGVLTCAALIVAQSMSNTTKENLLNKQASSMVEQENNRIVGQMQARLEDSVSALKEAASVVESYDKDKMFKQTTMDVITNALKQYGFDYIALVDAKGNAKESTNSSFDISEEVAFKNAFLGDTVITYESFRDDTGKTVVFMVPVYKNEEVIAVIRASWEQDTVSSILSITNFRGKEEVCILDKSSGIIDAMADKVEEESMLLELWAEKDAGYLTMEQAIKQGRYDTEEVRDRTGIEYYVAYKGLRNLNDWGIAIVIPKKEITALLSDSYPSTNDFVGCMIGIVGVLALLAGQLYQSKKRYRLEELAYIDQITNSYNFKGFMKRMNRAFSMEPNSRYAFLELTFHKFDYYVEMFGNEEGNKVLAAMAEGLKRVVRSDEAFCRYNTINFILLLKFEKDEELRDRIQYLINQINTRGSIERINDKFELKLLIGAYDIESTNLSIETMIFRANAAMNSMVANRKASFEFYKESMENTYSEEKEYEEHMYDALRDKQFLVYLQPKFSLKTGIQVGAEALVRWMHPEKGLIYPQRFIPLFEKNGFIVDLDMYILEELCRKLKLWIKKGYHPNPLSINISMHNLYKSGFVSRVTKIVEQYGIPTNLICIEIGEKDIVQNLDLMEEILEDLKKEGFLVSMDDFGDSTTSMNTLFKLNINELKIDRKFLLDTEKTERGKSIINSIIDTSKRLDIQVVAEGVDNLLQARMLRDIGCDMMQGFVFSEPLPFDEYERYAYGPRSNENKISI